MNENILDNKLIREEEIKQFYNINMGKIQLTDIELIKAELLDYKNFIGKTDEYIHSKQIHISERWHFIEKELHKTDFWAFIPHKNQYNYEDSGESRINYLFEFVLFRENEYKNIYDKYDLYNRLKIYIKELARKTNKSVSEQVWEKLECIFEHFINLYENDGRSINYTGNKKLYNLLSFYVYYNINMCNKNESKEDIHLDNYKLFYELLKINRNEMVKKIKDAILNNVFKKESIEEKIKKIRYGQGEYDELREILLLYNIILLYKSKGIGNRYNFLEHYKDNWTREHIFPQNYENVFEKQKEILTLIASNLDTNGNIVLKKEVILKYVNLLYIIKNDLNEKDLNKKTPLIGLHNPGIIDFNKDKNVIDDFIEYDKYCEKNNIQEKDKEYIEEYSKKLYIIKKASEFIKRFNLYDKLDALDKKYKNETDYINHAINHIKNENYKYYFLEPGTRDLFYKNNENKYISKIVSKFSELFNDKTDILYNIYKDDESYIEETDEENNIEEINEENSIEKIDIEKYCAKRYDYVKGQIEQYYSDKYEFAIENIDQYKENINLIKEIIHSHKNYIKNIVKSFFEDEFNKCILDNSIGNLTLLNKSTNGHHSIGNKLFYDKRNGIFKKMKEGEFIPFSTILVFSNIYTKTEKKDNYWLFESRYEYLKDILNTVTNFFYDDGE